MSLIEKLEKISTKIFQESLKTYHFRDVIKHKNAKPHNLVQYLSVYPNKGVGFHVRRKGWPKNMFVKVTSTDYKSNQFGKVRGMQYLGSRPLWKIPKRISGASNRGIWQYEIGEAIQIKLDNGLTYTPADFKAYRQSRKSWVPKKKSAPKAEQPQQGQKPQQATQSQAQQPTN